MLIPGCAGRQMRWTYCGFSFIWLALGNLYLFDNGGRVQFTFSGLNAMLPFTIS